MASSIATKGEEAAGRIMDAARTGIRKDIAEIRALSDKFGGDFDVEFETGLLALIEEAQTYPAKRTSLNLREFAEAGNIGMLYSIYGTLSRDAAHPTFTSLRRHTEILREENGNWKVILSEEPEQADGELRSTIGTAALALFGTSISVCQVRGISGLSTEIEEIGASISTLNAD